MVDIGQERAGYSEAEINWLGRREVQQGRGDEPRRETYNDVGLGHHPVELPALLRLGLRKVPEMPGHWRRAHPTNRRSLSFVNRHQTGREPEALPTSYRSVIRSLRLRAPSFGDMTRGDTRGLQEAPGSAGAVAMPVKAAGLTAAKVRTAAPGRYGDGGGLYLLVRPPTEKRQEAGERGGGRFRLFRYTRAGKMRAALILASSAFASLNTFLVQCRP